MKKWIAVLCVVAVAAVAALGWVVSAKNGTEAKLNEANEKILSLQAMSKQAEEKQAAAVAQAQTEAQAAVDAANQQAADLTAALEAANQQVTDLTAQNAEAAQALEAAQQQIASLTAAKDSAEAAAAQAAQELVQFREAVAALVIGSPEKAQSPTAFLMYANADRSVQYYGGDAPDGVIVTNAEVTGEGEYTVGLSFAEPAQGLFFLAVGVENGEASWPGWVMEVKEVRINGQAIELGKGYTTSDDGVTTRVNLFNEWVVDLPADARLADADAAGASAVIVDPAAFDQVTSLEVVFSYGEPAQPEAEAEEAPTEEVPAEEVPVEEVPAEEAPAEEAPAEEPAGQQ